MHFLTKLRAILTMGVVSGIFWGVAFAIGRMGYDLIIHGAFGINLVMSGWVALLGFIGGVVYATGLALMPRGEGTTGLPAWQSALFGAIGGVVVMAAVVLAFLGDELNFRDGVWLIPAAVCAVLGAGTALAISGTAKRGALPEGGEKQKVIEP